MPGLIPITISPLDAWRGGRKPTRDKDEAAQRRYEEAMAKAMPPKVCACHPAPVTDVTRYPFLKTFVGQPINNPESLNPKPNQFPKNE